MPNLPLAAQIEALLFVATEPLDTRQIMQATGANEAEVKNALGELRNNLRGGIILSELGGRYRLVSAPDASGVVQSYLKFEAKTELSRPALETLAIIAYRGPITKAQINNIRGVVSDNTIRNLLSRGLIAEAGRSEEPGRPVRYSVSHAFLQQFGLSRLEDLPPLPQEPATNTLGEGH